MFSAHPGSAIGRMNQMKARRSQRSPVTLRECRALHPGKRDQPVTEQQR
jgi:hypothetical protein